MGEQLEDELEELCRCVSSSSGGGTERQAGVVLELARRGGGGSVKGLATKESSLLRETVAAVESCREESALEALLACVSLFLESPKRWRRLRLLASANGVFAYAKQLLSRARGQRRPHLSATLAQQLLAIATRDPRAAMKIRLSGLLASLLRDTVAPSPPPLHILDLLVLAARSGTPLLLLSSAIPEAPGTTSPQTSW